MKTARKLFILPVLFTLLYSCQKEVNLQDDQNPGGGGGGTTTSSLVGDYDFVGLIAHTNTTVTVTDVSGQLKSTTVSDYTSKNPSGTANFNANTFSYKDIAYSIDTMLNVKTYFNGLLIDNSDLPFAFDYPASSASLNYVKNSADSITFPNPVLNLSTGFAGAGPTGPMGARLSWSGSTLSMRMVSSFTNNVTQQGVPGVLKRRIRCDDEVQKEIDG